MWWWNQTPGGQMEQRHGSSFALGGPGNPIWWLNSDHWTQEKAKDFWCSGSAIPCSCPQHIIFDDKLDVWCIMGDSRNTEPPMVQHQSKNIRTFAKIVRLDAMVIKLPKAVWTIVCYLVGSCSDCCSQTHRICNRCLCWVMWLKRCWSYNL